VARRCDLADCLIVVAFAFQLTETRSMRLPRAALSVAFVAILAIAGCNKPAEEAAPEDHAAETTDGDHADVPVEEVVTMEQAVADARAAAEAPATATPASAAPVTDAPAADDHDAAAAEHATPASASAAAAPHASGH
jgi:hypothetical protein